MNDQPTAHPDPATMRKPELEACGCERCQDALRIHAMLDELITSQDKTLAALDHLEQAVAKLERRFA
jgi:hypothetical protein